MARRRRSFGGHARLGGRHAGGTSLIGFVVAAVAVGLLVVRATRRLGGVTGDIFGAAIEVMLAILLLSA